MSETLSVAFVVEGTTDFIILKEVVAKILDGHEFVANILQPEISEVFHPIASEYGFGWPGVCRWCLQATEQSDGPVRNNPLFGIYDILIIHIDADVGYIMVEGCFG